MATNGSRSKDQEKNDQLTLKSFDAALQKLMPGGGGGGGGGAEKLIINFVGPKGNNLGRRGTSRGFFHMKCEVFKKYMNKEVHEKCMK